MIKVVAQTLRDMGCEIHKEEAVFNISPLSLVGTIYRLLFFVGPNKDIPKYVAYMDCSNIGPVELVARFYTAIKKEEAKYASTSNH